MAAEKRSLSDRELESIAHNISRRNEISRLDFYSVQVSIKNQHCTQKDKNLNTVEATQNTRPQRAAEPMADEEYYKRNQLLLDAPFRRV